MLLIYLLKNILRIIFNIINHRNKLKSRKHQNKLILKTSHMCDHLSFKAKELIKFSTRLCTGKKSRDKDGDRDNILLLPVDLEVISVRRMLVWELVSFIFYRILKFASVPRLPNHTISKSCLQKNKIHSALNKILDLFVSLRFKEKW